MVQTPNGERYTRNGHFKLDDQGSLVTEDGFQVQSDGGAITLAVGQSTFNVGFQTGVTTASPSYFMSAAPALTASDWN